jgi:hypothetical protein
MKLSGTLQTFRTQFAFNFAVQVQAAVAGEDGFSDDIFPDFFDNFPAGAAKPQKWTLLHELIHNVCRFNMEYSLDKVGSELRETFRLLLEESSISCPKWIDTEEFDERRFELCDKIDKAIKLHTPTVFYFLFSDLTFLTAFQQRLSLSVSQLKKTEHESLLRKDGVFVRPTYIPTWLKTGVYFRDQGRCQSCLKDISGLLKPYNDIHLDHIIPLAQSGTNDPSNFQLLCVNCNLSKGKKLKKSSARFSPHW